MFLAFFQVQTVMELISTTLNSKNKNEKEKNIYKASVSLCVSPLLRLCFFFYALSLSIYSSIIARSGSKVEFVDFNAGT